MDNEWIIDGLYKELSDDRRKQILTLIRNQYRELRSIKGMVTCPCGFVTDGARHGYRCFFCGVVFCKACARKHFGQNKHE